MLVYVIGPLRGERRDTNLNAIHAASLKAARYGNTVAISLATDEPMEPPWEDEDFLEKDLVLLQRCDACITVPNWKDDPTCVEKVHFAEAHDIPIYHDEDVQKHPTEYQSPQQAFSFMSIVMRMYRVHLEKNADYSPANILGAGEIGLITRLWDKTARLMNLTGFRITISKSEYSAPKDPRNENIWDTYMDLAVYAVIGMLLKLERWGK